MRKLSTERLRNLPKITQSVDSNPDKSYHQCPGSEPLHHTACSFRFCRVPHSTDPGLQRCRKAPKGRHQLKAPLWKQRSRPETQRGA